MASSLVSPLSPGQFAAFRSSPWMVNEGQPTLLHPAFQPSFSGPQQLIGFHPHDKPDASFQATQSACTRKLPTPVNYLEAAVGHKAVVKREIEGDSPRLFGYEESPPWSYSKGKPLEGRMMAVEARRMNKAHVQHLEAQLLKLAREAKQCKLDNIQGALVPTLSEAEIALADSFLQDILSIFPLLGLGVFEKTETTKNPTEILTIDAKGIKASGYEDAKGFIVLEGSHAVKDEVPKVPPYVTTIREDLKSQGVIVPDGSSYRFSQDHVFSSPSRAAAAVMGRSANGRIEWKNVQGKTLKELQQAVAAAQDQQG